MAIKAVPLRRTRTPMKVPQATRKYVKSQLKRAQETKYIEYDQAATAAPYDAPLFDNITGTVTEGTGPDNRIGDAITYDKFQAKFVMTKNVTQVVDAVTRIMVLQWFQDDTPTMADLFTTASRAYSSEVNPILLNKRGKVLFDRRYVVSATAGEENTVVGSFWLPRNKLAKTKATFDNAAVTGSNHLYFIAFSNIANGTNTEPLVSYNAWLSWKE